MVYPGPGGAAGGGVSGRRARGAGGAGDAAVLGVRSDAPDPPPVLRAVRARDAASFQLPDGKRCEQRPRLPVAAGAAGAGGGLKRLWSAGGRRSESFWGRLLRCPESL